MHRRLALGAAFLALIIILAACRPVDGGAGGSASAEASAAGSAAAPTDAPVETPSPTMGSDYAYSPSERLIGDPAHLLIGPSRCDGSEPPLSFSPRPIGGPAAKYSALVAGIGGSVDSPRHCACCAVSINAKRREPFDSENWWQ